VWCKDPFSEFSQDGVSPTLVSYILQSPFFNYRVTTCLIVTVIGIVSIWFRWPDKGCDDTGGNHGRRIMDHFQNASLERRIPDLSDTYSTIVKESSDNLVKE
jgi:hypothetical protein